MKHKCHIHNDNDINRHLWDYFAKSTTIIYFKRKFFTLLLKRRCFTPAFLPAGAIAYWSTHSKIGTPGAVSNRYPA